MRPPLLFPGILVFLLTFLSDIEGWAQTELDGFDPNLNGPTYERGIALQPDGKIILTGDFTTVTPNNGVTVARNRIARFYSDGSIDANFNPDASNTVNVVARQPDGKILIGGYFTSVAGQSRNRIARLNSDGSIDSSFNASADDLVRSIEVQPNGQILIGGYFTQINGQPKASMVRVNSDGSIDTTFNPSANSTVIAMKSQPDGKILVIGYFTLMNGQPRSYIARLNYDGSLDMAFNPNAGYFVDEIAIQPDGKIIAVGEFNESGTIGGQPRNRIARLDPVTGMADSFNPNANCDVKFVTIQSNGKIVVCGCFTTIGGQSRKRIARLDPVTGTPDSFNPNVSDDSVNAVAIQPDGKIVGAGFFATVMTNDGVPVTRNHAARWLPGNDPETTPTPSPAPSQTPTATPLPTPIASATPTATPSPTAAPTPSATPASTPGGKSFNLSTRGYVQTGDRVMIAGFIQDNNEMITTVFRAIGPALANAGVPDCLADPMITIYDSNGHEMVTNDDWQDDPNQAAQLRSLGLAPSFSTEAAVVSNLPRGSYTAITRGKNDATGNALVEVYCLP